MTYQARPRLVSFKSKVAANLGMVALFPYISFIVLFHLCRRELVGSEEGGSERTCFFWNCMFSSNSVTLRWKCWQLEWRSKKNKLRLLTGVQSYDFIWIYNDCSMLGLRPKLMNGLITSSNYVKVFYLKCWTIILSFSWRQNGNRKVQITPSVGEI